MLVTPRDLLLSYQRRWVEDTARFKIGLMSRQIGKSFMTAEEAVADSLARKTTWVIGSAGERQALEWMLKAREWLEAYGVALEDYKEISESANGLLKNAEAKLPNGSRIIALPANPATMRGYSANLVLDEFAFHEDPDGIWRAIYPSISNPMRGTYKVRVVSTPNGMGNKFADLWNKAVRYAEGNPPLEKGKWSGHFVDILGAIAGGLQVDIEELKAGLDDPDGWAVEFLCQILDTAAILLSYDIIAGIENPMAMLSQSPEYWMNPGRRAFPIDLGIDFGRKKDLTVCWSMEDIGGYQMTREVLELKDTSTTAQAEILSMRVARARRVALDYTGPGVGLGDMLVDKFGEWKPEDHKFGKIELVVFSQGNKAEMFSKLRLKADAKQIGIPKSKVIREDLHSMHRVTSPNGGVSYRAPHSKDGHADRCTALALAVRAGDNPAAPFAYRPIRGGIRGLRRRR